jgi:hypothetical protein
MAGYCNLIDDHGITHVALAVDDADGAKVQEWAEAFEEALVGSPGRLTAMRGTAVTDRETGSRLTLCTGRRQLERAYIRGLEPGSTTVRFHSGTGSGRQGAA